MNTTPGARCRAAGVQRDADRVASRPSSSTPTRCCVTTAITCCRTTWRFPNLQQKSKRIRAGPDQAAHLPREGDSSRCRRRWQRVWLLVYGIALVDLPRVRRRRDHADGRVDGAGLGVLMAIGGVVTWVVVPVVKTVQVPADRPGAAPQAAAGDRVQPGGRGGGRRCSSA